MGDISNEDIELLIKGEVLPTAEPIDKYEQIRYKSKVIRFGFEPKIRKTLSKKEYAFLLKIIKNVLAFVDKNGLLFIPEELTVVNYNLVVDNYDLFKQNRKESAWGVALYPVEQGGLVFSTMTSLLVRHKGKWTIHHDVFIHEFIHCLFHHTDIEKKIRRRINDNYGECFVDCLTKLFMNRFHKPFDVGYINNFAKLDCEMLISRVKEVIKQDYLDTFEGLKKQDNKDLGRLIREGIVDDDVTENQLRMKRLLVDTYHAFVKVIQDSETKDEDLKELTIRASFYLRGLKERYNKKKKKEDIVKDIQYMLNIVEETWDLHKYLGEDIKQVIKDFHKELNKLPYSKPVNIHINKLLKKHESFTKKNTKKVLKPTPISKEEEIGIDVNEDKRKYTSHFFITSIYNICFNEIIANYSKEGKEIGRVRGGHHDIVYRKNQAQYWISLELTRFRRECLSKDKIDDTIIKDMVKSVDNLLIDSNNDPKLMKASQYLCLGINRIYGLNLKIKYREPKESPIKIEVPPRDQENEVLISSDQSYNSYWVIALILITILAIGSIYLYHNYNRPEVLVVNKPEPIIEPKTITEIVPVKVSMAEYTDNIVNYLDKEVDISGYLWYKYEGDDNSGVYLYILVDDLGNELKFNKISSKYSGLFEKRKISEELYLVSGKIIKRYDGYEIQVKDIKQIDKPTKIITNTLD